MDFIIVCPPPSIDVNVSHRIIPLGGLYLADSLIKHGLTVSILDDSIDALKTSIDKQLSAHTIAIGISTLSGTQLKNALTIAKYIRNRYPKTPLIWGGAHVTAAPLQTLESDLVDYVVWGEGEIALPLLLDAIRNKRSLGDIPGIGFKCNGASTITARSNYTPLEGVFNLPYHLLDMPRYARKLNIGLEKCFYVFSSRGCPFRCKFCSNPSEIWPNTTMRYHTIEHILSDIETLVTKYGADGITFGDENFLVKKSRLISVCEALLKANFGVKYRASARADLLCRLGEDTLDLMKKVGFIGIAVGIESGSQRMLDFMGKDITLEQIRKVDSILTKKRFFKTYNFMTCLPGETVEDVKDTLRLIVELAETSLYSPYPFSILHKFIPLPGTELYKIASDYGFKPPHSIEGWTDFDVVDVSKNTDVVRPWLSQEMAAFVNRANELVEGLNVLFIGDNADKRAISEKVDAIRSFVEQA